MTDQTRPTEDDVRKAVKDDGIEFLFANFVDMHARPSAKLIPAEELESLFTDGAGFAGFAAGDIGQQPNDPDMIAMPDAGSFTKLPWKPNVGWFASKCDGRGGGVAVLPPDDPPAPDGAVRGDGVPVQDRL